MMLPKSITIYIYSGVSILLVMWWIHHWSVVGRWIEMVGWLRSFGCPILRASECDPTSHSGEISRAPLVPDLTMGLGDLPRDPIWYGFGFFVFGQIYHLALGVCRRILAPSLVWRATLALVPSLIWHRHRDGCLMLLLNLVWHPTWQD